MRRLPSLIALRFFEETARHLSFNRAARTLCVTQGAVSRQIKALEESLKVKLFERDHKGIRLTPAGAVLMPCVSGAFDLIERGTRQLDGAMHRERLVVCLPPTFATQWLSSRLNALAVGLPGVELSLRTQPNDACHCAIRFGREALAQGYSELLMTERHALVGAATLEGQDIAPLLDRLPALHVLHDDIRLDLWPNWLAAARLPQRFADDGIEFSSLEQAIHAARRGVGLAVVDLNMIADELADGVLVKMSEVEVIGPYAYWLDVPERHVESRHVSALAAWLLSEVAGTRPHYA
ncbi:LysR family transcriptional regulator [Caballeronia humi]|uniref:LysR family transcriptional regulator n=1 Tax=Caballeronia humi TaxID=326474 RepID=A0A158I423_9BURK|nr:LysR family transcriptional regulator [Caballeronia humi]SAL50861.1 LysR family transcriptional regulator [Caballeronia humi]